MPQSDWDVSECDQENRFLVVLHPLRLNSMIILQPGAPGPAFGTCETTNPMRADSERLAAPQVPQVLVK